MYTNSLKNNNQLVFEYYGVREREWGSVNSASIVAGNHSTPSPKDSCGAWVVHLKAPSLELRAASYPLLTYYFREGKGNFAHRRWKITLNWAPNWFGTLCYTHTLKMTPEWLSFSLMACCLHGRHTYLDNCAKFNNNSI